MPRKPVVRCRSNCCTRRSRLGVAGLSAVLLLSSVGCFSSQYTLGNGPRGGEVRVHRTWYGAWGFIGLNRVDGGDLVGPGEDLRVTTSFRASDGLVNLFLGPLGFFRKTTLIEK